MNSTLNKCSSTDSIQGYLYKKGDKSILSSSSSGAWKKRWFSLSPSPTPTGGVLKYYKNPTDDKPKGTINIQAIESFDIITSTATPNINSNTITSSSSLSTKFYFNLKTKSRIYYLFADSEQDRDYWNINLNISILNLNDSINNNPANPRPRSNTLPSSTPTLSLNQPSSTNVSNNNVSNKPPLPPKPTTVQQSTKTTATTQSPIKNSGNNVILNKQQQAPSPSQQNQQYEIEDENISLCGAKIRDFIKNHSSGYITSMVAVTRSKIWCADSQGNICTYTLSRNGSVNNPTMTTSSSTTDKLKKGSQWKEHTQMVTSLVYVPSQKLVYSSGLDGKICAWNKTDYSLVFSHTSKFPIYDMLFSKNDLLVYCGGLSSSSPISTLSQLTNSKDNNQQANTLSLFDTITKEETEIPFSTYLPNLFNKSSSNSNKKRKFTKMIKYDEKIIICTDRCEIIKWSPWDNEICKYISIVNAFDITAIGVIGETIWVCSTQDSGSSNLFSTLPCIISVLDINSFKRIRCFECTHPISQFNLVNGYIWAVTRGFVTIYEPTTGQLPFETIQLKEDMNFRILYSNNIAWVGGTWLWRFQIFDNWIRDNLEYTTTTDTSLSSPDRAAVEAMIVNIQPIPDYSDFDHVFLTLDLIKERLIYEHSNQLYDILLTVGENDQLLPDFQIQICKILRAFCRNKTMVMKEFILSDNNRIYRISKLLSSYLQSSKTNNNVILTLESLKSIEYLITNFEKFSKQFLQIQSSTSSTLIETIIKLTILQPFDKHKSIISISLIILYRIFNSTSGNSLITSSSNNNNPNSLYNNLKEKVKLYFSTIFFETSIDDKTKIAIINIVSRFPNELKEQFKKDSNLTQIYQLLNQGTSLCCNDLIIIINQILKDSPKIKDLISKSNSNLLKLIEGSTTTNTPTTEINDRIRIYQIMSNPTYIQKSFGNNGIDGSVGGVGKKVNPNRKLIISSNFQSPIESVIFTLNSILHSLKSTSFKTIKITILDINLPKEFHQDFLSSVNGSIININFILPSQSFLSNIKFKFHPKDLSIKIKFEKGLSIGETTISNFSITGDLQLGFATGTAKPEYISFLEEPDIKFDIDSSGIVLNIVDLFVKSIVKKTIKKKFVHPNRFYLPSI